MVQLVQVVLRIMVEVGGANAAGSGANGGNGSKFNNRFSVTYAGGGGGVGYGVSGSGGSGGGGAGNDTGMVLMEQLIQEVVRLDIVQALVKVVMEEKVWLL